MIKKHFCIFFLLLLVLPVFARPIQDRLDATLLDLRRSLKRDYLLMSETRDKLAENYEEQHQKMVIIMKQCNELSLKL